MHTGRSIRCGRLRENKEICVGREWKLLHVLKDSFPHAYEREIATFRGRKVA
jgi:hypothetical protein